MNTSEGETIKSNTDYININQGKNNQKKYIPMDINQISNTISQKINNIKSIDDELIDELCNGLKLYCQNHNKIINDWFEGKSI